MDDAKPFLMLNALWFKPGGRETYQRYLEATGPLLRRVGGKAVAGGIPRQELLGSFDADLVFFVEYPNWQAFLDLTRDPDYLAIRHLRQDAIVKSLLIRCEPSL